MSPDGIIILYIYATEYTIHSCVPSHFRVTIFNCWCVLAGVIILYIYTIESTVHSCVSLYLGLATLNCPYPQISFNIADGCFSTASHKKSFK